MLARRPATLEQRCAVLCAAHPSGFVTGPTAGALARPATHAAADRRCTSRFATAPPAAGTPACASARPPRSTTIDRRHPGRRHRHGVVGPPGVRPRRRPPQLDHLSVLEQLLQLTTRSPPTSSSPSAGGWPTRPGAGSTTFARTPRPRSAVGAGRLPPGGASSPTRCAVGTSRSSPRPGAGRAARRHDRPHRPRRPGRALGRRAGHPPRAPHARRRTPATPAAPAGLHLLGVADRGRHRASTCATSSASPTTWRRCTTSGGANVGRPHPGVS